MDFSIIIPAKNEEINIANCLDSIHAMGFDKGRYEVILVDNGSSDRTAAIAKEKGAKVYIKPELTIAGLRNFGAFEAQGRVLAFLDADCTVAQNWLHEACRYLDDEHVVCFGSPPVVPADASWVQKAWFQVRRKKEIVQEVEWFESMNMFVRRTAFDACGGFDETLVTCEDYDLSLRLKKQGLLLSDGRIVAVHHGEAATVGHFFRKERWRAVSNFSGMLRHGIVLREIPSLVAPTTHCLLLILAIVSPVIFPTGGSLLVLFVLMCWQVFLMFTSFKKNQPVTNWLPVLQLFWLFNVYFTARGLAMFKGNQR